MHCTKKRLNFKKEPIYQIKKKWIKTSYIIPLQGGKKCECINRENIDQTYTLKLIGKKPPPPSPNADAHKKKSPMKNNGQRQLNTSKINRKI